ncbi:M48 family peptidase (macronuclear) [Tetrahymena thermophila SB210]|uniref:Ste24 endopeptidase n=1 Tax=Tetrahymena thermophila (strain SB210) TaxID=312017 RepID=I7MGD8_TETTS|nr:M48 family peptidase [Tetrahymena thermophila SB210]EAR85063.2 M48 family peptidase [Tetrahymena thermophila SB210]|eukprot:XP_001032726.2 M48 family peptidase [Tetrahymena thermophila SB210]
MIQNYKQIKKMPSDVRSLGIDPDQYKRAMQYAFDKLAFQMYVYSVKTGLECIFSLTYVMPLVWNGVTKLFPIIEPTSEFQRGFMFLLIEALKSKFIDVPIALYETFVIEEKYGFNKKTLFLFFNDLVIEAGLSVIIIPTILYGYIYVVDKTESNEWFFFNVEIFIILFMLAYITINPNFIAPAFNKFEELEDGELKQEINELAISINFPLKDILKMDGSRRSEHSNAYFYGLWNNKRIVLFDTLLNQMSQNEIMSVVGHELGHWKHSHSKIKFLIYCLRIIIIFSLFSFFRNSDSIFLSFGFTDKSTFIGTTLFFNLFSPINSVIEIIDLVISRYFEFQADTFACNLGYGYYLMSGLTKIQKEDVSTLNPDPWYAWFKHSHPGLFERLKRIKQTLFQIEKQNGLENQQIQEKIQNFLEEYVSINGRNHQNIDNSNNRHYINSPNNTNNNNSNNRRQLGSQYQGFLREHANSQNQINGFQSRNPIYHALDRNGSNSLNSSMQQFPITQQQNNQNEIDSNSNQIGYQQALNNTLIQNFANPNTNSGFNLNLLFNYEQQQNQQLIQQQLQMQQMQQQLVSDLLNQWTNQQYLLQQQQQQGVNSGLQLNLGSIAQQQQQQQQHQQQNVLRNNQQLSNSSSSYLITNRKVYKHSISNIESLDSRDYSSSVDINHPNKKLYKEDVYLFGSQIPSNDIRKRQVLQQNQSRPQSPPEFQNNNNFNNNIFNNNISNGFHNSPNQQVINSDQNKEHYQNGINYSPTFNGNQKKQGYQKNGTSLDNNKFSQNNNRSSKINQYQVMNGNGNQ